MSRSVKEALWLAVSLFGALVIFPRPFVAVELDIDGAYRLALNLAHAQRLVFGDDVLFTFGPMGFLLFPNPLCGSPDLVRIWTLGMYGAVCLFMMVAQAHARDVPTRGAIVATIVTIGVVTSSPQQLSVLMALLVLCADPSHRPWHVAALMALAVVGAAALLCKTNVGIQGVALLGIAAARAWPRDRGSARWVLAALAALPVALAVLSVCFNGGVAMLPAYLRLAFEVAAGYTEGMGCEGRRLDLLVGLGLAALLFLIVPALARERRALVAGYVPALLLGFFAFKHAYVRQDVGHVIAFPAYVALCVLLVLARATHRRDRRMLLALLTACLGLTAVWHVERMPRRLDAIVTRLRLGHLSPSVRSFVNWRASWERERATAVARLAPAALPPAVETVAAEGTVDVAPWAVQAVAASRLAWRPRPVFHSYSAYTPILDRLNAGVLASTSGPDTVIVHQWNEVDMGHPFLVGCRSWRTLLDLYDVVAVDAPPIVLRRRRAPRFAADERISEVTAGWRETVEVPPVGDIVVARAHIDLSMLGRAARTLFRVSPIYLHAVYDTGPPRRWRVTRPTIAEGFLVSHLPRDIEEGRRMLARPGVGPRVTSITFETAQPSFYGDAIRVEWRCLARL